jgi:GNAT superfamily N-acetyltransferase
MLCPVEVEIHPDGSRDALNELVRLHRTVYESEYDLEPSFASEVAVEMARLSRAGWPGPREGLWLARADGRAVGSVTLIEEDAELGRLGHLVLLPDARGTGAGRRLVETVLAAARAAGYERLHLFTFSDLRAARSLYLSAGFERTSRERRVRWGRAMDWDRYELAL